MEKLVLWSRDNPYIILAIALSLSLFFGYHAKDIRIDASAQKMMADNDPNKDFYKKTVERFGSDNVTVVYVKGENLFTQENLQKIQDVVYELEEIEGVSRVNSIFNVTNFKGVDGELSTNRLIDDEIPDDEYELLQIRDDALRSPLIKGRLLSADSKVIAINVLAEQDGQEEDFDIRIATAIDETIAPLIAAFPGSFQLGTPLIRKSIKDYILADQKSLIPLSTAILLLLLIVGIRTFNGALIPIVTGSLSVLWTLGFMDLVGVPIQLLTVIVPTLLLILGATEDMHIISEYFEGLEEGKSKLDSIEYFANKVTLAITLTALTTFIGFSSIMLNDITMLKEFGIASSFGLFVNYFITITVCPVLLRWFGEKNSPFQSKKSQQQSHTEARNDIFSRMANVLANIIKESRIKIFLVVGLATAASIAGAYFIKVDNDLLGNFKESDPIRIKSKILQRDLSGSQTFYITLETNEKGYFKDSEILQKIAKIQDWIANNKQLDSSTSLADQVSLIHREMHNGDQRYYQVPDKSELIPQYLLFFTRQDIDRFVTANYDVANIVVRHSLTSSWQIKRVLADLKTVLDQQLEDTKVKYKFTSEGILINDAADSIAVGQVFSIGLLLVVIFVIMSVLFVNVKAGALSLIPNVFPVFLLFGIMGLLDIPLNTGTALIAAIAIGIAVDDTIHFMVRYNADMKIHNDQVKAMESALHTEIRPVMATSVALALGFGILSVSHFVPIIHFGILTAIVMLLALTSDLLLTPAILCSTRLVTLYDMLKLKIHEHVLHNSPLFQNLRQGEIKRVVLLGHTKKYTKEEVIINQGDTGRQMYIILNGQVRLDHKDAQGKHQELATFNAGDVFGEVALIEAQERTATVVATDDNTEVLEIDWNSLDSIRRIYPRLSSKLFLNIARILGKRLSSLNERVEHA